MGAGKIGLVLLVFGIIAVTATSGQAHAQTDELSASKQNAISENLQDNPLAQKILKNIEKTKKQIAELEQREDKKKEIEEKRAEAFILLQNDLENWKTLWEEFTFDYKFERQSGIFWDQYNFTKSKITAGRVALQEALNDGANAEQARSAYAEAAKIKRSELIEANSIFNVKHGLAYYNQQILFDSDGQFHDMISGDQLRKYYQDFRINPAYLNSNPKDETSWTDLAVEIQSECRNGYVLMHRFQTNDYVCVTEQTSEMWSRHNMGKPMTEYVVQPSNDNLTADKFREDAIKEKVRNINNKIVSTYRYYEEKMQDLGKRYDLAFDGIKTQQRDEEQKAVAEYADLSKEKLLQRLQSIRDTYQSLEQIMLQEKEQALYIMESNHEQSMKDFVKNFKSVSDVRINWNSDESRYEAIRT